MIIIRKQQTGEVFDIPADFRMQINNTSPVFNALGSLVVSASIPNDRPGTNRRLLGFPNRADSSERPPSKMPVIVSYGSFTRSGSLTVNSAINSKGTFSCSIAFDEGEMYERMKDVRLKDITALPILTMPVAEIMDMLNGLAHYDDPQSDLSVFPLCLDNFENWEIVEGSMGQHNRELFFLNNYKRSDDNTTYNLTDIDHYYNSSAERIEVNLPGFGVSPFVRVWKILELIIGHLGYTMGSNPYKEHFQLRKLIAVNNVADAIVAGRIDYRVLMPDTTMGDFLSSLFARHGARLFFNSNTRVVDIILLKDILQSREYTQLDRYQSSPYDLVFTKAKQLKITGQRSLYRASTSADTWEDFYRKYNGQIGSNFLVAGYKDGGIWYSASEGIFFQTASTGNAVPRFISSIHFDWDKKVKDMDYEEISGNDECMTQWPVYYGKELVCPIFSTGPAFFYTGLLVKREQVDEQTVTCPLAFAFSMGNASPSINFGSIFPYNTVDYPFKYYVDEEGNEYNYALTFSGKDGSFQRFFRDYDAFFRYSNHEHTCDYKLPVTFLSNINMQVKAMLANQPLLLDRIPHQLGAKETVTVVSRTTRLYEPYNLEEDYFEPVSEGILYKWVRADDISNKVLIAQLAKIDELKAREGDPHVDPPYRFVSLVYDRIVEDVTKPSEQLWLLPPTQSDYENGRTASRGTYKVKVNFKHTYQEFVSGNWSLFSDKSLELIVTYDSWWKPALVSE